MNTKLIRKTLGIRLIASTALLCTTGLSINAQAAPGNANGWGAFKDATGSAGHWKDAVAALAFEAERTTVESGETVLLSWAADNVKDCYASGSWDGEQPSTGFYRTPPLDTDQTYVLTCRTWRNSVQKTVSVSVLPSSTTTGTDEPEPAPTEDTQPPPPEPVVVSLSASPLEVDYGGLTTLSWSASGADSCSGWGQTLATSGSYTTGALTTSTEFSLSCTGAGGTDSQTVAVSVLPQPEPVAVSLTAAPREVAYGTATTLSWSASGADSCSGWGQTLATSGSYTTGALTTSTEFSLSCTGAGGTDSQTVDVSVLPPPEPSLRLSGSSPTVKSGESVTLTWTAENVSGCEATGAWAGTKAASGSEQIGPLSEDSTFTLSCQSPAGEVVAMTSVLISEGGTTLSWEPPRENVDGSPLSDLIGYRVYVGLSSRAYDPPIELNDPTMSSYFVELLPGDYYISMTAVDAEGNESAFSNEVLKTVL